MNLRKAISPVIATVIIIAITLAITIAAVGWILGLWGTVAGGTEYLQIFPDSYLKLDTSKNQTHVILHVVNKGSAAAVIYKVEVVGLGTANISGAQLTIKPGVETTLGANEVYLNGTCIEGNYYLVIIYTKAGNVYRVNLLCKAG